MIILFIVQSIFVFFSTKLYKDSLIEITRLQLRNEALIAEKYIGDEGKNAFKGQSDNLKNRITIIDSYGNVIYDTHKEGEEEQMDSHRYREELRDSFDGKEGFSVRTSKTLNKKLLYYSLPLKNGYIIRVSSFYIDIKEKLNTNLILICLFFIFFDLFCFFFIKTNIFDYYKNKLYLLREYFQRNDASTSIYLSDIEELQEFYDLIRVWQEKYNKNNLRLKREKNILNEVIKSIDIGVLVLSDQGKVVLNNEIVKNIFPNFIGNNEYYIEFENLEITNFIKNLILKKQKMKDEIRISDQKKFLMIYGNYLEGLGIFVLTIKDITKDKEINELQKRFITNVSHELKTPLTNIKGYLIALEEEDNLEMKKKFINIIRGNQERIQNMVEDLISLSKNEKSRIVNIYPVNIDELINNIKDNLSILIKKNQVEILVTKNTGDNFINIDYDKVFSVLKNLIENGIKYNNREEKKIIVNIVESEDEYIFQVEDNGIGIGISEKDKVFERFYRIDKSRKDSTSTGLGLSIVKEIIEIYGGELSLHSEIEKGSKFAFAIRKW